MSDLVAVSTSRKNNEPLFVRQDGTRHRVLYAEDQATARIVTKALLERMGFDVEAVEDGELAFEKAKTSAYDVILLDIEMPVMDGVTAARHIRAEAAPCKGTPILALSAFLADSTEHSVWRDAFDSALPKPANSNELQRAMQKVLVSETHKPLKQETKPALWEALADNLPQGTLSILLKAAAREMQHLIIARDSCLKAGDIETAQHCEKALLGVANSFDVKSLELALRGTQRATTPALLAVVEAWQRPTH